MHLIFVLLFVGGCTIQGTQSFSYPPGAKEILIGGSCLSYPPGRSCKKDYQCGVGGSCEYIGKSLMKKCVCNPEPPQPPAPSICKNGATCRGDIDCGDGGYCDYIHPPSSSIPPSIRGMMHCVCKSEPPPPPPPSCEIGAPCTVDPRFDNCLGGVGVCEYINWSLLTHCVCKSKPPQPPAPSICENGARCVDDNQCGGGFCQHFHPIKLQSQCVCKPEPPPPPPPVLSLSPICKKGNPCIDNKHCGKSGTCVKKPGAGFGFWDFGECVCSTVNPIDCKTTYYKVKKVVLNQVSIDMNNPMNVAFEKCLLETITSDPLFPPNYACSKRILVGFHKCEDKLRENVTGFIDVMKMMTENFDLK